MSDTYTVKVAAEGREAVEGTHTRERHLQVPRQRGADQGTATFLGTVGAADRARRVDGLDR